VRRLSSSLTFVYKFVFPTLWIGGFATATLLMFVGPADRADPELLRERWIFAGITVLGGGFLYWFCARLKRVSLGADRVVISNYLREIEVPLRDVEAVSGSLLMSPELVWLRFRRPTRFGSQIVFMPRVRLFVGLSRHPLVAELRALIGSSATHA
jgi:hypothetical protein